MDMTIVIIVGLKQEQLKKIKSENQRNMTTETTTISRLEAEEVEEGKSDFYMVLPSNACMEYYPHNKPYAYSVTWNNPKVLDENIWKVALTEASFAYPKYTLNKYHHNQINHC